MTGRSNDLRADLEARMAPSPEQLDAARNVLSEQHPLAITALVFPGKEFGLWPADQPVEHPDGAFACANDDTFHIARQQALKIAARWLGENPGTLGYTVVRDTGWSVFEEILPASHHLDH